MLSSSGPRLSRWLLAAVIAGAAVVAVAPATPATADSGALVCTGHQTVNWKPGLLFTPRTVTASGSTLLGPCVDSENRISSGSSTFGGEETAGCLTVASSPGAEHIIWDTGETTTFSWTAAEVTAAYVPGAIVATIRTDVESGKFAGMQVLYVITSASLNLLGCLAEPGLRSASGPLELTILP